MIAETQNIITLDKVSFTYGAGHDEGGVRNLSLTIKQGEVVLLCGSSGCGKTTLTRLINGLVPHYYDGKLSGSVCVNGKDIASCELYDLADSVGSVFQNPRSQFFTINTTSELAFCSENLGVEKGEIQRRIHEVSSEMNMKELLGRNLFKLSGGQKQQIACASVSVASPDVLVLDEPSSNLDMKASIRLMKQIELWKKLGKTVVVAEHRLHYLRNLVDRVVLMNEGRIAEVFHRDEIVNLSADELSQKGLRIFSLDTLRQSSQEAVQPDKQVTRRLKIENMSFAYKHQPECLKIESCELPENAVIACIGHNGAGKSTFARCLCGLEKKAKGTLAHLENDTVIDARPFKKVKDKAFLVMQDVNHQLFTDSVLEEVEISFAGKEEKENSSQALEILSDLNLMAVKDAHPMSLSGGQKQRVAIASALASSRPCIVFDEPTSGLDLRHMHMVAHRLKALQKAGRTVLVITHDPELILQCCTHVAHFEEGTILEVYPLDKNGLAHMLDFFIETLEASPEFATEEEHIA
ncbi:MAG: ABC transporter ATP-binding protein [Raoultibacter sp.]